jgi:antitoxin (DNA-binding transcriptional repressor) of toxin-antitoxin stability system
MNATVSITELHEKTGDWVRQAAASPTPIGVTDRGKLVAVLSAPPEDVHARPRRKLLPEYQALMRQSPRGSLADDLDAVRGDR